MIEQTFKEWEKEGTELFGGNKKQWKFKCPRCGNVASIKDFLDIKEDANTAAQNCIGRFKKDVGCDWAAYGIFGTLNKGRFVITDDGDKIQVFDFAVEKV